jgi:hypothetical protein
MGVATTGLPGWKYGLKWIVCALDQPLDQFTVSVGVKEPRTVGVPLRVRVAEL